MGNMDNIKALSPFPGLAITGRICGSVSGALMALGLYFGSDNLFNYEANTDSVMASRVFLQRFEDTLSSLQCKDVQELIVGQYMDPLREENQEAWIQAKGREKCSTVAGIGARLAAEVIIESMEEFRSI